MARTQVLTISNLRLDSPVSLSPTPINLTANSFLMKYNISSRQGGYNYVYNSIIMFPTFNSNQPSGHPYLSAS